MSSKMMINFHSYYEGIFAIASSCSRTPLQNDQLSTEKQRKEIVQL